MTAEFTPGERVRITAIQVPENHPRLAVGDVMTLKHVNAPSRNWLNAWFTEYDAGGWPATVRLERADPIPTHTCACCGGAFQSEKPKRFLDHITGDGVVVRVFGARDVHLAVLCDACAGYGMTGDSLRSVADRIRARRKAQNKPTALPEPSAEWLAGARWICETLPEIDGVAIGGSGRTWGCVKGSRVIGWFHHGVIERSGAALLMQAGEFGVLGSWGAADQGKRRFTRAELLGNSAPFAAADATPDFKAACDRFNREQEAWRSFASRHAGYDLGAVRCAYDRSVPPPGECPRCGKLAVDRLSETCAACGLTAEYAERLTGPDPYQFDGLGQPKDERKITVETFADDLVLRRAKFAALSPSEKRARHRRELREALDRKVEASRYEEQVSTPGWEEWHS